MNILFCGDKNIEDGLFLSAVSLSKNSACELTINILTAGTEYNGKEYSPISRSFAEKLQNRIQKENEKNSVELFDVTDEFHKYLPYANMDTRFTPLCMLRLFADGVSQISGRVLYLDADVLCRDDFSALEKTDIGDAEIAGVPDRYGKWFFGNILRQDYLNSGVLLMDMDSIRKSGLFERCRSLCRKKKMLMPDQTALNKLARKKKLPRKYNEQSNIRADTIFKHFTTYFRILPYFRPITVKPWEKEKMHDKLKIYEFDDIIGELKKENI